MVRPKLPPVYDPAAEGVGLTQQGGRFRELPIGNQGSDNRAADPGITQAL